eukprot:gene4804-1754_t
MPPAPPAAADGTPHAAPDSAAAAAMRDAASHVSRRPAEGAAP